MTYRTRCLRKSDLPVYMTVALAHIRFISDLFHIWMRPESDLAISECMRFFSRLHCHRTDPICVTYEQKIGIGSHFVNWVTKTANLSCGIKMQNGHMLKKSTITSQTAETHGACGKPFRPSLTTSPRHRPVMRTHPSPMHSTTFIHGLKCRMTHLHKNCPHLPTTGRFVCLQPT